MRTYTVNIYLEIYLGDPMEYDFHEEPERLGL